MYRGYLIVQSIIVGAVIFLAGCKSNSDRLQMYDANGSIYVCGNNPPYAPFDIPDWSLAFLTNGTVVHTYRISSTEDKETGHVKFDYLQTAGKYKINGDEVEFEGWCNVTPKSKAEELTARHSTQYQSLPTKLKLELAGDIVVGVRPLEYTGPDDRHLYWDSFTLWDKTTQESRAKMIANYSTNNKQRWPGLKPEFIQSYLPPAKLECAQFEDANAKARAKEAAAAALPDPRGTYSDAEGGLSFQFLSTGKFYHQLMGSTAFGSWTRNGGEVELTYEDGSSSYVKLGDGYIVFNGVRFTKK